MARPWPTSELAHVQEAWQDSSKEVHHMKIAIGSDHAGFHYKEKIRPFLVSLGHSVTDFGTHSEEPVDYPLFIRPVAEAVARGEFERGIVLGGSGNGEAIVANRIKGIRCALCWNAESARLGRQHNNANVLSLGERMMSQETALQIVQIWLDTPFDGGRHQHRLDLIDAEGDVRHDA
jgi:ribose 5-phosphate isomerase B